MLLSIEHVLGVSSGILKCSRPFSFLSSFSMQNTASAASTCSSTLEMYGFSMLHALTLSIVEYLAWLASS